MTDGQFDDAEEVPQGLIINKTDAIVKDDLEVEEKINNLIYRSENDTIYRSENDTDGDDESCDDEIYDEFDMVHSSKGSNPNQQNAASKVVSFQPSEKVLKKFIDKINVGEYNQNKTDIRTKDKADRATVEQVMDPRTRMILFKLLNRGFIGEINGCISTGKEANVYHATGGSELSGDIAIKVYKTSILVFKDRDRYVSGEFRFRQGYGKKNPRKMVQTWAEKEMRNLVRIHNAGIPSPKPILLRSHVLLMEFLGGNGWPAPRLKDANLSESKARELYRSLIFNVRRMFHTCKLVHGDLSEYNLLLHQGEAAIIDVSQSVEHDHPHALEFLRKDLFNVTQFFRKLGVAVLGLRELFDWVVELGEGDEEAEQRLGQLELSAASRTEEERTAQQIVDEEVFKQVFIPRRLTEVAKPEVDIAKIKEKGNECVNYGAVTGVQVLNEEKEETDDSESDDERVSEEDRPGFVNSRRPQHEDKDSKKERKKAVKDAKAEKRKVKVPKHVKKRKEKSGK